MLPLFSENGVLQNQIMVVVPDIKVSAVSVISTFFFGIVCALGYQLRLISMAFGVTIISRESMQRQM
jgi:hypothetical protein